MEVEPMSSVPKPSIIRRLRKQNTWSPDSHREAAWLRRKESFNRFDRSQSLTNDDMDELRACFELGFGFDSTVLDPKLTGVFPALEFYNAVNKQYSNSLSRSSSMTTVSSNDTSTASPVESSCSCSFFDPGEEPDVLKTRLKQWAQVVACLASNQPPRTEW